MRFPTDSSAEILPYNATALERDLLRTEAFDYLGKMADRITTAKYPDQPDSFVPWLLVEYNLIKYLEFVPDERRLLSEGLQLNRLLGTPAAVEVAASWLEYPDITIKEHTIPNLHFPEWEIQLGSDNPLFRTEEDLCRMARLMKLVQPARSRFRRISNPVADRPMFVWDNSKWGALWSGVSGVYPKTLGYCGESFGMQVALGRRHSFDDLESLFGDNLDVQERFVHRKRHSSFVGPAPWPILDDEHYYSFSSDYLTVDDGIFITGLMVDESEQPMIDELGNPMLYTRIIPTFVPDDSYGIPSNSILVSGDHLTVGGDTLTINL